MNQSSSTDLFWEILFLGVHDHQRPVLGGVEAREGHAQHLHEETGGAQVRVEVLINNVSDFYHPNCIFRVSSHLKVGVNVIGVPVQGVVLHLQVVARKVSGGVSQVVVLVPQDALRPGRGRYHFRPDW